jgi:hypothetical protein
VFCTQKSAVSAEPTAETTLFEAFKKSLLANLGARETAVVLNTHLAAAQQVSHCRHGFLGVLGARTHSKN